jgi:hypothetical protein
MALCLTMWVLEITIESVNYRADHRLQTVGQCCPNVIVACCQAGTLFRSNYMTLLNPDRSQEITEFTIVSLDSQALSQQNTDIRDQLTNLIQNFLLGSKKRHLSFFFANSRSPRSASHEALASIYKTSNKQIRIAISLRITCCTTEQNGSSILKLISPKFAW